MGTAQARDILAQPHATISAHRRSQHRNWVHHGCAGDTALWLISRDNYLGQSTDLISLDKHVDMPTLLLVPKLVQPELDDMAVHVDLNAHGELKGLEEESPCSLCPITVAKQSHRPLTCAATAFPCWVFGLLMSCRATTGSCWIIRFTVSKTTLAEREGAHPLKGGSGCSATKPAFRQCLPHSY